MDTPYNVRRVHLMTPPTSLCWCASIRVSCIRRAGALFLYDYSVVIKRAFSLSPVMMRSNLAVCNRSTRRWLQLRYCFQPRTLRGTAAMTTNVFRFHSSELLSSSDISARNQGQRRTLHGFKSLEMYRNRALMLSQRRYSSDKDYKRSTCSVDFSHRLQIAIFVTTTSLPTIHTSGAH